MFDKPLILAIDDEETILTAFQFFLKQAGFEPITANSGREGIDLFERHSPDLVLVDLMMPDVDGKAVIKYIAEHSPKTPIIVASGTDILRDAIEAIRLGAWDYLVKPITHASVISHVINKALEKAALLEENQRYQQTLEQRVKQRTEALEQANHELKYLNHKLKDIFKSASDIANSNGQEAIFLLKELAKHIKASGGSLYRVNRNGLDLICSLDSQHTPPLIPFPLRKNSVLAHVLKEKKPLLLKHKQDWLSFKTSGYEHYRNQSAMIYPLCNQKNDIIAILSLHGKDLPPFTKEDLEIGTILTNSSFRYLWSADFLDKPNASHLENLGFWSWSLKDDRIRLPQLFCQRFHIDSVLAFDDFLARLTQKNRFPFRETVDEFLNDNEDSLKMEFEFHSERGEEHWLQFSGTRHQDDLLFGTITDITHEKTSALAMENREQQVRGIIENSDLPMMITNHDHQIEAMNSQFAELSGYSLEILKNDPDVFINPNKDIMTHLHKSMNQHAECQLKTKEDKLIDVEVKVLPLGTGHLFVFSDITHRKQEAALAEAKQQKLEEQLARQRQELLNKTHQEGVAVIATDSIHNIGNILNTVNISLEEIIRVMSQSKVIGLRKVAKMLENNKDNLGTFITEDHRGKLLPQYIQSLSIAIHDEHHLIQEEAQTLLNRFELMTDLIATQQRYAKYHHKLVRVKLGDLIEDSLRLLHPYIQKRSIHLERNYQFEPDAFFAKSALIHILTNLIKNACEAMGENTTNGRDMDLKIETRSYEHMAEIIISDNGSGILDSDLEKIFDHGFTTKRTGHGFGLHSCQMMVEDMDGQLFATSPGRNQGSQFHLRIPVNKTEDGLIE